MARKLTSRKAITVEIEKNKYSSMEWVGGKRRSKDTDKDLAGLKEACASKSDAERITIASHGQNYTHINSREFDADYLKDYMRYIGYTISADQIVYEKVKGHRLTTVYSIDHDTWSQFPTLDGRIRSRHISTCILSHIRKYHLNKVYALFRDNVLYLAYEAKIGGLKFYNQFKFKSTTDVLYFIALVYQEEKLSRRTVPLVLAGELTKSSEIYRAVSPYFQRITFDDSAEEVLGARSYQHMDKYAILQCE